MERLNGKKTCEKITLLCKIDYVGICVNNFLIAFFRSTEKLKVCIIKPNFKHSKRVRVWMWVHVHLGVCTGECQGSCQHVKCQQDNLLEVAETLAEGLGYTVNRVA